MLINLSNHSLSTWQKEQRMLAEHLFGTVFDIPFPAIDPDADEANLKVLAHSYIEQIISIKPQAVHIMGELTFTFYLVYRLKEYGIPCVASTTHRNVVEKDNQTKVTTFKFAGFRNYF